MLYTRTKKKFYVQCTTWRDKKQVCFLSSNFIGASVGNFVKRSTRKGADTRDTVPAPIAQTDYAAHMGAVDQNDRDSADYSTTIHSVRYYLRIFCWVLDRVVHTCFVVVCFFASVDIGNPEWKKYLKKAHGRHDFQID